jgi:hypothetical protein
MLLPKKMAAQIKSLVYDRASEFGYMTRSRPENNRFLDSLVEDEEIGGVLRQYLPKGNVRTYIKDGILNAYAKQFTKNVLADISPSETIQQVFGVHSEVIQRYKDKSERVSVSRSDDGGIFIVSGGTVLKWETALRKALELIARQPALTINGVTPAICLNLAESNQSLTEADKKHIATALAEVGVKALFCDEEQTRNRA